MTHKSFSVTAPTSPLQENFVALLHQIFITFRYQINVSLSGTRKYICLYCSTYTIHIQNASSKMYRFYKLQNTFPHGSTTITTDEKYTDSILCVCVCMYVDIESILLLLLLLDIVQTQF